MSERKTSEIKLRVTPSFKAAVQLAAEQAGETMSVYIESASQDRMRADRLGGIAAFSMTGPWIASTSWAGTELPAPHNPPVASTVPVTDRICDDGYACLAPDCACPDRSVPAKDADDSCTKNCHPWEWCECKQLRRD